METVNSSRPLVPFGGKIRRARLIGRRKRFLMDVEDASGPFTAHTNNTGTMLGLLRPGSEVLLSVSDAPSRKHACTVEAVRLRTSGFPGSGTQNSGNPGFWVGVNTAMPTRILKAAWAAGLMPECAGYETFKTEPRFAEGRLDALFTGPAGELYVETKNVTMVEDCQAQFPDAPSERASKHMGELARIARGGARAAVFFAVQRPDGQCFGPAEAVDPEYARAFRQALAAGVEAWAYVVDVAEDGYRLSRRLRVAS
ncbi:DNA/RNA nuclease SfsA [Fundidesulfovibrio terrae]|uniref:DNA/RNA nuclease SfsA n=1 Tax=Fundidesulfovibrio terrae TaxID=2922866 RepID=UPI00243522F5|nr:DNA/RNA nuclease SfsA [Fundidesulfovibrio terrae]